MSMPDAVYENVHFGQIEPEHINLSLYQCHLNKIYQIASPVIENIYGVRTSKRSSLHMKLPEKIAQANQLMQKWYTDLPPELSLSQAEDVNNTSTTAEKLHKLQGLSLQLTYDNLMIVINRPLLQSQHTAISLFQRPMHKAEFDHTIPDEAQVGAFEADSSFKRSLDSALRISQVDQHPCLVRLATETHLVSFLGINLFTCKSSGLFPFDFYNLMHCRLLSLLMVETASFVMVAGALLDPLSNIAQEAKRGIARTLQVQRSLSKNTILSVQSSVILEYLVQMILDKERQAMFASSSHGGSRRPSVQEIPIPCVPSTQSGLGSRLGSISKRPKEELGVFVTEQTQTPCTQYASDPNPGAYLSPTATTFDPWNGTSNLPQEGGMAIDSLKSLQKGGQLRHYPLFTSHCALRAIAIAILILVSLCPSYSASTGK